MIHADRRTAHAQARCFGEYLYPTGGPARSDDALGEEDASQRLITGMEVETASGILTLDFGGRAITREITDAVCQAIRGRNA